MRSSWLACEHFALPNRLSDAATKKLLKLISMLCPSVENCPRSTYELRNQLKMSVEAKMETFCSHCMNEIPTGSRQSMNTKCKCEKTKVCYLQYTPHHLVRRVVESQHNNDIQMCLIDVSICRCLQSWVGSAYPWQ